MKMTEISDTNTENLKQINIRESKLTRDKNALQFDRHSCLIARAIYFTRLRIESEKKHNMHLSFDFHSIQIHLQCNTQFVVFHLIQFGTTCEIEITSHLHF